MALQFGLHVAADDDEVLCLAQTLPMVPLVTPETQAAFDCGIIQIVQSEQITETVAGRRIAQVLVQAVPKRESDRTASAETPSVRIMVADRIAEHAVPSRRQTKVESPGKRRRQPWGESRDMQGQLPRVFAESILEMLQRTEVQGNVTGHRTCCRLVRSGSRANTPSSVGQWAP
jgi:hypothetical protein